MRRGRRSKIRTPDYLLLGLGIPCVGEGGRVESRALCSLGSRQLSIAIGQVPLTLYFPEEPLLEKASQRYARFLASR